MRCVCFRAGKDMVSEPASARTPRQRHGGARRHVGDDSAADCGHGGWRRRRRRQRLSRRRRRSSSSSASSADSQRQRTHVRRPRRSWRMLRRSFAGAVRPRRRRRRGRHGARSDARTRSPTTFLAAGSLHRRRVSPLRGATVDVVGGAA